MKNVLVAVSIAVIAACHAAPPKQREETVPVTVATATQQNVPVRIRAIGTVQPYSTVAVRAQVTGQLTRVWFREGEEVRKGAVLFTIDPRPYQSALQQARANLARDEANLRNAEAEARRYADLIKKDYVTHEDYDRIVAAAESARAVVAADNAAIENAQVQLSYCEIRSPLDGRTGSLMVHQGNLVRANDTNPLVTINQVQPVYVQFSVPESQLGQIRARGEANVPVIATAQNGGASAEGRLSFIDNSVDTQTGTIALKGTFPNTNRALWPGQFVTVAVNLADRPDAIVVPAQAVQTGQRGTYVYVVKQDNGVEMRPVLSAEASGDLAVIQKGLTAGETVVTDGQVRLTPKSKVEIKNRL